jgi:hypothetical protein
MDPLQRDAALILLKDLILNQTTLIQGREMELIQLLLELRKDPSKQIAAATTAILDILLDRTDPIYALSCLRSSLEAFLSTEAEPSEATSKSLGMALKSFGSLFKKLPAEVLDEELPLTKPFLLKVRSCSRNLADSTHVAAGFRFTFTRHSTRSRPKPSGCSVFPPKRRATLCHLCPRSQQAAVRFCVFPKELLHVLTLSPTQDCARDLLLASMKSWRRDHDVSSSARLWMQID